MLTNLTLGAARGTERAPGRPAEAAVLPPPAVPQPAERGGATPADADAALHRAAEAAVARMFAGRTVSIASYHDESTGRMVYRVSDAHSGEVLLQQPAEALLRLYASARAEGGPLLAIEA